MPEYLYPRLSQPDSIRLLQLLPRKEDAKYLRCKLFEYPLQSWGNTSHPYEALSYVWGSEEKPCSIFIDNLSLAVTENLYTLLLRLQAHDCSRIVWVDAVCINQTNEKEKETQIPFMPEIYAKATRVIVWLGKAEDNSDQALETIRLAGQKLANYLGFKKSHQEIIQLLKRQWFRRIWVLQEVAAARHVSIMCGSIEIDGHAFCLGLDSLGAAFEKSITQATFLIRGAIFRSRQILQDQERLSLRICTLGELVDMYHTYKATILHDKVYALLGMCSDDSIASLKPNYNLEWKELMCGLVKFILGDQVSVGAWNDKEIAVIKSKGCVLGKVLKVERNIDSGGNMQSIEAVFKNTSGGRKSFVRWILRASAQSIKRGDFICLLRGTSKPIIARLCEDHFIIIMITAVPLEQIKMDGGDVQWPDLSNSASFTQDILLVWNWELSSAKMQDLRKYNTLVQTSNGGSSETKFESRLRNVIRIWNVAHILEALGENKNAMKTLQEAVKRYSVALGQEQSNTPKAKNVLTILSWAAWRGHTDIVRQLLGTTIPDVDSKDKVGRSPLSYAAEGGHEAIFQILVDTGKVDIDSKDKSGQTPFSYAAEGGHKFIVQMLVDTGKVNLDSKDADSNRTPFSYAAGRGHEFIVQMLVDTGKVALDSKDISGRTPLSYAAERGHEAIVQVLVDTGKVAIDSNDLWFGWTPFSYAAARGHETIVQMLLDTGKVDIDSKDYSDRTPFSYAVAGGHEAIVQMLLDMGKVAIDSKDKSGRTPFSYATGGGHRAIVQMLLDTGKVVIDSLDRSGRTPFSYATGEGQEAIFQMLVNRDKVDIDSKDWSGRTPFSHAAEGGHRAIIQKLVDTGKVNIDSKDDSDRTPLSYAVAGGHEAIFQLLVDTGKVNLDSKDDDSDRVPLPNAATGGRKTINHMSRRTPLSFAAEGGHEAIVQMLVDGGKVAIDSKEWSGWTPFSYAAAGGHEAIVQMLLDTGKVAIDLKDWSDRTPFSYAAEGGHGAIVQMLVNTSKVSIDSKDMSSRTPFSYATGGGHEIIVRMLLDTGKVAIDSKDKSGRTPFSYATGGGHRAIVQMLLDTGKVDIDSKDYSDRTPFSYAAAGGHEATVQMLLDTGKVDINSLDKSGRTPLSYATGEGHESVIDLLQPYTSAFPA